MSERIKLLLSLKKHFMHSFEFCDFLFEKYALAVLAKCTNRTLEGAVANSTIVPAPGWNGIVYHMTFHIKQILNIVPSNDLKLSRRGMYSNFNTPEYTRR